METRTRRRRAIDLISVAIFLLAVGLPLYGTLFRTPGPLHENRDRFEPPRISADRFVHGEFVKHFELYLGDYIGYRDVLLDWHRQITYGLFHESVSKETWLGKDGWLFVNQSDPFRGNPKKPSPAARVDLWIDAFAERNAWLKSQGIEYIVVITPDKAAVYPEFLRGYPARHPPLEMGTPAAKLLNERGVKCVNVLPAILDEKAVNPNIVYHKTDSHWTHDGARAGYKAIAEAVRERFPDFRIQPDSAYAYSTAGRGDLRKLAGIGEGEPSEQVRIWTPLTTITSEEAPDYFGPLQQAERLKHLDSALSKQPMATGPRILFLQDSFGEHLHGFLRSDFRQVSNIGTYGLPLEAVRIEKPQLVIQLLVARQLYYLTPYNRPEVKAAAGK